ncbi:hypothetical protein Q0590_09855 [Rhodocytophaga aerolata]|uniref:AtpZ/AtpI family protein n=1 Tax=Rhodocytophaga aerolata TaxID=455078 RepID=A0ABT8R3P4_9BACT|nr:hypothetical protein [Rhodocytophaga aerolata]MDO1446554.1 hypothetical protein [Rhodocytophaga aerolata]
MKAKDLLITMSLTTVAVIIGLFLGLKITKNIHDVKLLLIGLGIGFIVPILYWTIVKKAR